MTDKKIQPPSISIAFSVSAVKFSFVFKTKLGEKKKKSLGLHLFSINFDKSKDILCVPLHM